jgi:DNA-binding response OmpR family regulator
LSVIVLTAPERIENVERAFDAGAHAYLVKPARMQELIAMIRSMCDWPQYNQFAPLNHAVRKTAR